MAPDEPAAQTIRRLAPLAGRPMYLPRRVYELLPYAYLAVGLAACIASYLSTGSVWSDFAFGGGAIAITGGVVLILRRRSYRDDEARYDRHSLDD